VDRARPGHRLSTAVAVEVYVALVAVAVSPVMEHLTLGRDESWVIAVALGGAHLWLGAAAGRAWVLLLPVLASLVAFVAAGAEGFSILILILGAPVGCGLTALGFLLAQAGRGAAFVPLAVAVAAVLYGVAGWVPRLGADDLPRDVQARLPLEESLGGLCSGSETSRDVERNLRDGLRVLVREVERRPGHMATYTYYWSDEPPERKRITVREVAEEQLKDVRECSPDVTRTLERALA
jgi:hypothetical protein